MSCPLPCCSIILALLLLLPALLLADEPPSNTIPIIGMLLNEWQLTPELLCEMSWKYFDGIECNYFVSQDDDLAELAELLEPCGFYVVLDPLDIHRLEEMGSDSCRGRYASLTSQNAFIEVDEDGDAITGTYSASTTEALIEDISEDVVETFDDFEDLIWFYRFFDEPAATQRGRQYSTEHDYDDYFPSYLTADTTLFRADSAGAYSWIKHAIEQEDASIITSTVFAGGPYIAEWAGASPHGADVPDAQGRAEIVQEFCNMRYQPITGSVQDNFNDLVMIDFYPFRHVGTTYQDTASYSPTLGDSLNTWLLDHMEVAMDSMSVALRDEVAEILYWPQAIGTCGGSRMWEEIEDEWYLRYDSYLYRFPSPAELRMQINLALLRQAKGLMPFCVATYSSGLGDNDLEKYTTGLLDLQMIPFDAPFEDWAYTGRPQDSLSFVRPDDIPPFMSGFDPLYGGPGMPPGTSGERRRQDFLEWKFAPYSRLWNALPDIFGEVAFMAPELADLYGFEDCENEAWVGSSDSTIYDPFVQPEVRVFKRDGSDHVYLFYVNRQCRQASNPMDLVIDDQDVPDGFVSEDALDHTRRFLIPISNPTHSTFVIHDTLEAGQARLVEFVNVLDLDADLRITRPDIHLLASGDSIGQEACAFARGDSITILAEVYNLGTEDASDILVTLYDVTSLPYVPIDQDTLDFDGLSTSGYETDMDTARFLWVPGAGAVGLNRLRVHVGTAPGEDETGDNAVSFPVLVEPVDFATAELHDPWDMDEATASPPDWYTEDIVDVALNWDASSWTDSVSGMFEGVLALPDSGSPFQGEILLLDSTETLDADTYVMISLAGVCNNPNSSNHDNGCGFFLLWKDDHENQYTFNLANVLSPSPGLGDGWDQWKVFEPYTMPDTVGWEGEIHDLRLRFQVGLGDPAPLRPEPIDIRLGWIRITE